VNDSSGGFDLRAAAAALMREQGFDPDFPPEALAQAAAVAANPRSAKSDSDIRDLRQLPWSSIDNDTSRDLDQIEVAESVSGGATRVLVGIADVDAFVPPGSAVDVYAGNATTTVYTGVRNFPMLPDALSTQATSLLEAQDNLAVIIEFVVSADGAAQANAIYRAVVRNHAQLTYGSVGGWLEGAAPPPPKIASAPELQAQLRIQDACAQALRNARHRHGALNIDTSETRPVIHNGQVVDVVGQEKNRATELIEDFMIAANEIVARTLEARGVASIRRVVKTPERWDRIVALARQTGTELPAVADSKALNEFLVARKAADPDRFADLSLAVIKLLGPGEYVLERPGEQNRGHFGLAVEDYTHSTAPNRRFADLVTQRLVKAVLASRPSPYADVQLADIAGRCTLRENASRKVEREMAKRIAAVAMSRRIGELFDAVVTGVTPHGTFVRVFRPRVEGLLVHGANGADVGDRLRVRLVATDPERGYIDFAVAVDRR
jgi:exoribonuclease-2